MGLLIEVQTVWFRGDQIKPRNRR